MKFSHLLFTVLAFAATAKAGDDDDDGHAIEVSTLNRFQQQGFEQVFDPLAIALLVGSFLFIMATWINVRSFQRGAESSQEFFERAMKGYGSFLYSKPMLLFIIQLVAWIALWLSFFFFVNDGYNPPFDSEDHGLITYHALWLAITLIVVFAMIMYNISVAVTWDFSNFLGGLVVTVIETLAWLAGAILAWIYFARLPKSEFRDADTGVASQIGETSGEELFLAIVLSVLVVHRLLVSLQVAYKLYMAEPDEGVRNKTAMIVPASAQAPLIGGGASSSYYHSSKSAAHVARRHN